VRLYDLQRLAASGSGGAHSGVGKNRSVDGGCVTLCGHSGPVFGVDHSADGRFLFSASSDGYVRGVE
jgi:WD40 repeat protein